MGKYLIILILIFPSLSTSHAHMLGFDALMEVMCVDDSPSKPWCVKVVNNNQQESWKHWNFAYQFDEISHITDFKDINWLLSQDLPKLEKMSMLEHAVTLPQCLRIIDIKYLFSLWESEDLAASIEEREPNYLFKLSQILEIQLRNFVTENVIELNSKELLIKHAFGLLYSMRLYNAVIVELTWFSATLNDIEDDRKSSWHEANIASNKAILASIDSTINDAILNTFVKDRGDTFRDLGPEVAHIVEKYIKKRKLTDLEKSFSYWLTQKIVILKILKNLDFYLLIKYF